MKTWTALVTCICLLAGVRTTLAQSSLDTSREDKVVNTALLITFGTTCLVQMYDAHTTVKAIRAGAREVNPILAPFSERPMAIVAVDLARATAINFAVRSIARRNRAAAIAIGAAINSAYLFVGIHNNSVANQMRAQAGQR
jgi:hypothetical protein